MPRLIYCFFFFFFFSKRPLGPRGNSSGSRTCRDCFENKGGPSAERRTAEWTADSWQQSLLAAAVAEADAGVVPLHPASVETPPPQKKEAEMFLMMQGATSGGLGRQHFFTFSRRSRGQNRGTGLSKSQFSCTCCGGWGIVDEEGGRVD